jgi:hypothetical protein
LYTKDARSTSCSSRNSCSSSSACRSNTFRYSSCGDSSSSLAVAMSSSSSRFLSPSSSRTSQSAPPPPPEAPAPPPEPPSLHGGASHAGTTRCRKAERSSWCEPWWSEVRFYHNASVCHHYSGGCLYVGRPRKPTRCRNGRGQPRERSTHDSVMTNCHIPEFSKFRNVK